MNEEKHISVTELGNPRKPRGSAGEQMLNRMNESHRSVTEWALGFFDLNGIERFLDIGCGGGETLKTVSKLIPNAMLTGVDYSELSVGLTRKNNADLVDSGKLTVTWADVADLPFADESFDRIITVESFYFWSDPQNDLREVCRVLSKGGVFLIVADVYGDAELTPENIASIEKYNLFNPTLAEFESLLKNAGFRDVSIHTKKGTSWICAEGRK